MGISQIDCKYTGIIAHLKKRDYGSVQKYHSRMKEDSKYHKIKTF